MKMRSPLNSMLTAPPIGMAGFPSALAEGEQFTAIVVNVQNDIISW